MRISCTVCSKLSANRAVERHFVSPQAKKMVCEWRRQKKKLQNLKKNKCCPCTHIAEWSSLEAEVRNWIRDNRYNRISLSTKIIIF
jgi:hypothetical protein